MSVVSLRLIALSSVLTVLACPAVALANHHHVGGSGTGADPDADCLVWGYVFTDGGSADGGADAGMTDAGDAVDAAQTADAATSDAGSGVPAGAVMVCLEHATLFGCDCAAAPARGDGWSRGAFALLGAMLLAARRRRSRLAPERRP